MKEKKFTLEHDQPLQDEFNKKGNGSTLLFRKND